MFVSGVLFHHDPTLSFVNLCFQLGPDNQREQYYNTPSTSTASEGDPEDPVPRRSRKKKKIDVNKVIQAIVRDKSRDRVISKKIRDVVEGVDQNACNKQSFGHWISNLMPFIDNDRFLEYASGIMNYTYQFLNTSQAAKDAGYVHTRSSSAPAPVGHVSNQGNGHQTPDNRQTPPRQSTSTIMTQASMKNAQPSTSTVTQPTNQVMDRGQNNMSAEIPMAAAKMPQSEPPTYKQVTMQVNPSSNTQAYSPPAVYGPNMELQTNSQLVSGQIAPPFLPADFSGSSGNVSYDSSGRSYRELEPVPMTRIVPLGASNWPTPGPSAPEAIKQPCTGSSLDESLVSMANEIKATATRLAKVKQEPKSPIDPHSDDLSDNDTPDNSGLDPTDG